MNDFHELVDGSILKTADERHQAARDRLKASTVGLTTAAAEDAAAKKASERAVVNGDGDPMEAEIALNTAATRLGVATKVHTAATTAHQAAVEGLAVAKGEAHRPVYRRGVELRLEAARKADDARAMLAEAEQEYSAATSVLNFATGAGCGDVVFDRGHNHKLTSHADEVARWGRNYHNAWWPGLSPEGNVL
jgi:hypothetical protein